MLLFNKVKQPASFKYVRHFEETGLDTFRGAQVCRAKRQVMRTADTQQLVEAHAARILSIRVNPGAARPSAHQRGRNTFCAIGNYQFQRREKPPEPTFAGECRDSSKYFLKVEELGGNQPPATL
jgi:Family of unknown function (DUF7002)